MSMSDKELDQLFQSKLESFEEIPSAGVWDKIDQGLKRRKYNYQWLYRVAACFLIGLAVWIFLPQEKPVTLVAEKQEPVQPQYHPVEKKLIAEEAVVSEQIVQAKQATAKKLAVKPMKSNVNLSASLQDDEPAKIADRDATIQARSSQAELPDMSLVAAVRAEDQLTDNHLTEVNFQDVKPLTIANNAVEEDPNSDKKQARVRSLGGLINLVIAKVDKREDKIIEFDESGDEESNLTALNLGILKIKKSR